MAEDQQLLEQKKHAACDECRTRKLKCSGEDPSCQRCQIEGISCVYSPRKKMGRPRKRARDDNEAPNDLEFNDAGQLPPFDFNSVPPANIVGIPGTGIPLTLAEQMPNVDFTTNHDPSLQWLDPMLRDSGLGQQPSQEFTPMFPWIGGIDLSRSPPQADASANYPTPPHSNNFNIPSTSGTCMCLPNLYITLSDLSSTKEWAFPMSVHKLKTAMQTSDQVLKCPTCPNEPASAMQNLMLLTTLLTSVTDCYRKVLKSIDVQAAQAEESGTSIQYRMGDSSPERWHLHTGTNDCPMGISIDLDASEFKMLTRKVIRADVLGAANSPMGQISIMTLVRRLEERQNEWHHSAGHAELRSHFTGAGQQQCTPGDGDYTCLKLIGMIKHHVELLGLS